MNLKAILMILAFLQFNHIVDFMIIMPLGPTLMRELNISTSEFASLVSSYTLSAGLAGFISSFWIDSFDRKKVLSLCVFGFSFSTLLCGFSESFGWLIFFRSLAGIFGGVIGSQILSIVGDLFPLNKRGSAMGLLMSSFSIASVIGVPSGLYLATHFNWNTPFISLGIFSLIGFFLVFKIFPPIDSHISTEKRNPLFLIKELIKLREPLKALFLMFLLMIGQFTVIPFIATYLVANANVSEDKVFLVYFCGGLATLFSARIIGKLADKFGRKKIMAYCTLFSIFPLIGITHIGPNPLWLILIVSTLFMIFISGRMIPSITLISSTVPPNLRGGFMSLNSTVQMTTSGFSAWLGGLILIEHQNKLLHYNILGYIAVGSSLMALWLIFKIKETN